MEDELRENIFEEILIKLQKTYEIITQNSAFLFSKKNINDINS
jgi:hypothetical protein